MRRTVSPVILYESWSEDPNDDEYLCERDFSKAPFGAEETTWATVYELTVKEIFLGSFSEEIGNIFYVRVCSPGFVDSDHRFRGRWRVELDGFNDAEARTRIVDYVENTRGVFLLKTPVEVLASEFYCEEW